jgi:hypothetical protein
MTTDPIDHPPHYNQNGVEVINVVEAFALNFNRGNALKYLLRAGKKPGANELVDLQKSRWFITREIDLLTAAAAAQPKEPS